jgi:hypothetical protein
MYGLDTTTNVNETTMKDSVTVPTNAKILVWWDGKAIAVVMGNTEQVIEQIETACREHSCFESVKVIRPVDINLGFLEKVYISVLINDGIEKYQGDVELTTITDYSPQRDTGWIETHYEISGAIYLEFEKDNPTGLVAERHAAQGTGGLYELAEELTDEFEEMNNGREWDGEYIEEIYSFIQNKLYGTA